MPAIPSPEVYSGGGSNGGSWIRNQRNGGGLRYGGGLVAIVPWASGPFDQGPGRRERHEGPHLRGRPHPR
eukprot:12915452-Heterocapsa_arctica.AAC.1